MPIGPVELLVIKFPGNQFSGDILPALTELVEHETVHIIDLMLLHKNGDGDVRLLEVTDLAPAVQGSWVPLLNDVSALLNDDDAYALADGLENDSSAGIILFENTWATRFADAVRAAQGEILFNERIPRAVIDELIATAVASD